MDLNRNSLSWEININLAHRNLLTNAPDRRNILAEVPNTRGPKSHPNKEFRASVSRLNTPHLLRMSFWIKSFHWSMFSRP